MKFRLGLNVSGSNISTQDIDISFDIDKTIDSEPNKSSITLWNISPQTYLALQDSEAVELYGAFDDNNLELMFIGNVDSSTQEKSEIISTSNKGFLKQDTSTHRSIDVPTTLLVYDGGSIYRNAMINKSYKGIISTLNVITDCLLEMGIGIGSMTINHIMMTDYVAKGNCVSILNFIAEKTNSHYNISNGVFYMTSRDESLITTGIVLTSQNSNRPERVKIGEEYGYKIETQLLPFLLPDTYCEVKTENLNGVFRIVRVHSRGDNFGTEGKTDVYIK